MIWNTARAGFASLLFTYAAGANQIAAADAAVQLTPNDPEAHYVRGTILEARNDLSDAIAEYRIAASLRPDDYVLWLALARAYELNGEMDQALTAARVAVPLAPFYAQPHWQLGNLLVRAGQRDQGFQELRLAGASNPVLLPGIIDLAWQLSKGDAQFVVQSIQPQSPEAYLALAQYFQKRAQIAAASEMFGKAGNDAEAIRARAQYLKELIAAKKFNDAYQVWTIGRAGSTPHPPDSIIDPGFEQESDLAEKGFGWRTDYKAQSILLSLDSANPREGRSSLSVEFKGESDPGPAIISQLVLVSANTHYQLRFEARTESIVTGGLPRVTITDATNNTALSVPLLLPQQSGKWQDYSIDFDSKDTTTAIIISLQRDSCSKSPCPIFGRLWLDDFSLQKR